MKRGQPLLIRRPLGMMGTSGEGGRKRHDHRNQRQRNFEGYLWPNSVPLPPINLQQLAVVVEIGEICDKAANPVAREESLLSQSWQRKLAACLMQPDAAIAVAARATYPSHSLWEIVWIRCCKGAHFRPWPRSPNCSCGAMEFRCLQLR